MVNELLILTNASLQFNQEVIVSNLNLTIKKSEHLAITGKDGSGKTTLLKALAGKQMVTSGSIKRPFVDIFLKKSRVNNPFFSHHQLTSYLDIRHSFKNLQNKSNFFYQQRYNASYANESDTVNIYLQKSANTSLQKGFWNYNNVVDLFLLKPLLNKHLIHLSNGETRRVRMAEALLKNPIIIFLNQPFAGIDVEFREKFNAIFQKISDSGITIIATCQEDEIPSLFKNIIHLQRDEKPQIDKLKNFESSHKDAEQKESLKANKISLLTIQQPSYKTVVEMKNVSIKYYDHLVLNQVNWKIKQGERWSLSGPNGAGKSTLVSLINGDHPQAYSNEIVLFDKPRGTGESIWEIKRKIGFVSPELFQFFPAHVSCKSAISSGFFDTLGFSKPISVSQKKAVEQWINLLDLSKYAHHPFKQIPITMQRLTLLARALVKNPTLLILDEPCQGFDVDQQNNFKNILDTLSLHSNLTWIYITHHQNKLPTTVTHELILNRRGEVTYCGVKMQ